MQPKGCFYRWYTPSEVCDILQKFDGVVFVGDESLADIYAGFNIILRQDLQTGSLRDWDMSPPQLEKCNCDAQFTSASCLPLRITSSDEVDRQKTLRSPYACSAREFCPRCHVNYSHTPEALMPSVLQKYLTISLP